MRFFQSYKTATVSLVIAGAGLVACSGETGEPLAPATPAAQAAPVTTLSNPQTQKAQDLSGLLGLLGIGSKPDLFVCTNNGGPYKGSATIGLLGGTVHFGPHTLAVPPLAVLKPTLITATTVAGDTLAASFTPAGTKFLVPPTLTLDYSHCANKPQGSLGIDFLDDLLTQILELLPAIDNGGGQVHAPIWHFSVYAASETRRAR